MLGLGVGVLGFRRETAESLKAAEFGAICGLGEAACVLCGCGKGMGISQR